MNRFPVFRNGQKNRGRNVNCEEEKKLEDGQLYFCLQIYSSGLHPIPLHIIEKPAPADCFIKAPTSASLQLSLASGRYLLETGGQ